MNHGRNRVDGQAAYVLHTYPFRETSLIVEAFSREHGRVALVARGARRPRSAVRGLLMAFRPVELGWFGHGEMRTLAGVEWIGGLPLLQADALLLGYYMNELLLKLLAREDAHPALFDAYAEAVRALACEESGQVALRRFELRLLKELGYGPTLDHDAKSGEPIDPLKDYVWIIEHGPVETRESPGVPHISGRTLLALARGDFDEGETLAQAKQLMRMLINHHLGGQPLSSRRVFKELMEL